MVCALIASFESIVPFKVFTSPTINSRSFLQINISKRWSQKSPKKSRRGGCLKNKAWGFLKNKVSRKRTLNTDEGIQGEKGRGERQRSRHRHRKKKTFSLFFFSWDFPSFGTILLFFFSSFFNPLCYSINVSLTLFTFQVLPRFSDGQIENMTFAKNKHKRNFLK